MLREIKSESSLADHFLSGKKMVIESPRFKKEWWSKRVVSGYN